LTATQRAALLPDINAAALERLLATIPAAERPILLRFFRRWSDATPEDVLKSFPELSGDQHSRVVVVPQPEDLVFEDQVQQDLLRQVLAPRTNGLRASPGEQPGDEA
jgi:hypothetical protein